MKKAQELFDLYVDWFNAYYDEENDYYNPFGDASFWPIREIEELKPHWSHERCKELWRFIYWRLL